MPCKPHIGAVLLLAGVLFTPGAVSAFTIDDGSGGRTEIPKFNIEEQARQFRTPDAGAAAGMKEFDTPVGKLQFGVQRGGPFDSGLRAEEDRRHFDRMLTPIQRPMDR